MKQKEKWSIEYSGSAHEKLYEYRDIIALERLAWIAGFKYARELASWECEAGQCREQILEIGEKK